MTKRIIFGVHLTNRLTEAPAFQQLITQYGCNIKTRIGLHNVAGDVCATAGLILLEMYGDEAKTNELEQKLKAFEGIEFKKMVFSE